MSDDSDFNYSDNEIDESNHDTVVENVLHINKFHRLKKPSRTEPLALNIEFNLAKSSYKSPEATKVGKIAHSLKVKKEHVQLNNKIQRTKKAHIIPKPLEKVVRDRISRTVAYERNRFLFDRWEAFVTSNRAQAHLVFPAADTKKLSIQAKEVLKLPDTWKFKSNLEKEIDKLDKPQTEEYVIEDDLVDKHKFSLTLEELKEKRKEAAKLRAHQSFKEAKARRQNKIKSKKYHRILRKEKIKQSLKEFEALQETDPEQALQKLEEIEKARALERFSLRHKSTGQWAKNKQVRAKYDKESRQVLAQQLQISRDLTQKSKQSELDSDEENLEHTQDQRITVANDDNPWLNGPQPDKDVSEFINNYRKFWTEQNEKGSERIESNENTFEETSKDIPDNTNLINHVEESVQNIQHVKSKKQSTKLSKSKKQISKHVETNKLNVNNVSGNWNIDELFETAEEIVRAKISDKMSDNQEALKVKRLNKKSNKTVKKKTQSKKISLDMPVQSKRPVIDEAMTEIVGTIENQKNEEIDQLKHILSNGTERWNRSNIKNKNTGGDIDPEEFMKPKTPTHLDSAVPDLVVEDNRDEDVQKTIIMEAFEDDDIVQDFTKEKKEEIDKEKPQNIDLNLPGWGSWAGTGINPKKQRKRKRFIVKMPEVLPRRDDNRGTLIINEKASSKIRSHQVTAVPFPFKSVKDYEASIRAPIGSTFVPDLAFRKFVRPAVQTRMGTIIEPAKVSLMMGVPKR